MEWTKKRIGDITEVITKGTTPTTIGFSFTDEGINFVKIECITDNGNFLLEKMEHISEECNERMKRSQLKENDILFSIAGAIGRIAIVSKTILPANTNQALAIIRLNTNQVLPEFLVMCLKSEQVLKQFEKKKQGVAQLNLSLKDIAELEVIYPNVLEQKRILGVLNKAQQLIDKRKEQIQACDELIKSQFIEMFGDRNTAKEKWECVKIEEIAEVGVGVVIKPSQYYTSENDGIKAFRSLNVGEMKIKDGDWVYFSKEGNEVNKKSILKEGQLLIVRSGYPGTACVVTEEYAGCNAIDVIIATPNKERINPQYMCAFTNFEHGKMQIINGTGGAAQQHFNVGAYKNMWIAVPPLKLQNEFAQFIQQVDKLKFGMEQNL